MDRNEEAVAKAYYSKGIWVLKERIKELAAAQKRDKTILRMPRKTIEQREALKAAIDATDYTWKDVSTVQCGCILRRPKITAYLEVYAQVRGKTPANGPGKDYYLPTYRTHLQDAQKLFDETAKRTPVA
jgi:hypothetical protein